MSARRRIPIPLLVIAATWLLSWFFARDLVKALEGLGLIPKRGLVFNDASDFLFSCVVLALACTLYALVRGVRALGEGRHALATAAEDDPRYAELLRQKDVLLRELKELEFDRAMRKIEGDDYVVVERRLRGQALAILKAVDELDPVRLYESRIRADLERYASSPASTAALDASDEAWRAEVLARPLYGDLSKVLGERDLLLAALRDYTIVSADVDRGDLGRSSLSVTQTGGGAFQCTLAELRARVLRELQTCDDADALRLARIAGVPATRAPSGEVRMDRGGGPVDCSLAELRAEALARVSRHLGLGAAA